MSLFERGRYVRIPAGFRMKGMRSLAAIDEFQTAYEDICRNDTDTTVNAIRDSIVAHYLGYDLINADKHGFDAKKSRKEEYLEIKQCSIDRKTLSGTWNDTNLEKADCFKLEKLKTAIAVWHKAVDLQFVVFGYSAELGKHLEYCIKNRKSGSRSTQSIPLTKFLDWGFIILVETPEKVDLTIRLLHQKGRSYIAKVSRENVKPFASIM